MKKIGMKNGVNRRKLFLQTKPFPFVVQLLERLFKPFYTRTAFKTED